MIFPPRSAAETESLRQASEYPLDPDVVGAVHRALWFLLPGDDAAMAGTGWTFEVAATRLRALPEPGLYVAWLTTIADRESRRHQSLNNWHRRKTRRFPDRADDPEMRSRHVAESLAQLTADERLALVLRLLLDAPAPVLATALGIAVSDVPHAVNRAIDRFGVVCDAPIGVLGSLPVPLSGELPTSVIPLGRLARRGSRLNYGWHASGFPTLTDFEQRGRRRALNAAAVGVAIIAIALAYRGNPPPRPTLGDAPVASQPAGDAPTEGTGPNLSGLDFGE